MGNEGGAVMPQQPQTVPAQTEEKPPVVVQVDATGSFNKLWIIIIVIVVLLVVVAGAVYFVSMQGTAAVDSGKREVRAQLVQSFGQIDDTLKEMEKELGGIDEVFADVDQDLKSL